MKRVLAFIAVFLLGGAVGAAIGARVGTLQFLLADAQYQAAIIVSEIETIRKGRADSLLGMKEMELDRHLANHSQYLESRLWWILPELRTDDDAAIRRAVAYRRANPYELPIMPGDDEFSKQVAEGQRRINQYVGKMLEHYPDVAAPEGAK